jgi:hypothetical protein
VRKNIAIDQIFHFENRRTHFYGLDKCHVGHMLCWTNVKLDNRHVGQTSCWINIKLDECHVGQMSCWTNVMLDKCHVGQMSVGQISQTKVVAYKKLLEEVLVNSHKNVLK